MKGFEPTVYDEPVKARRRARDNVDKGSAKSTIEPTTNWNSSMSDLLAASVPVSSWSRIGR